VSIAVFKFKNGQKVRSTLTGFTGTIASLAETELVLQDETALSSGDSVSFKFELETKVESKLTGFKGTISMRSLYINGCLFYLVIPKAKKSDVYPSGEWITEEDIKVLESPKGTEIKPKKVAPKTGGPHSKNS